MELQHTLDGPALDRTDSHGRAALNFSWLSMDSLPLSFIHSGDNSAGNGGDGHFAGSLLDSSYAAFKPFDLAEAGANAEANGDQSNIGYFDQAAMQTAGLGGDGGDQNAAFGGVAGVDHSTGFGPIPSDQNSAGDGGDGHFAGVMIHDAAAAYSPINIAVAGYHATADAHQSNVAHLDQSAIQIAGVGGHGGTGNVALGEGQTVFGFGHGSEFNLVGSDVIARGDSAGNGGDGFFSGAMIHESFALYDPINIAVAGANATAHAVQTNNVDFEQGAFQIAGVGGQGGNGNAALAGHDGSFGSDAIALGANSAGDGGAGHFSGSIIDVNIAIYAPINIAIAGYNSTASADQTNNVQFDQSAIQIAGIGGNGGDGNIALSGDFVSHLLTDHQLADHPF